MSLKWNLNESPISSDKMNKLTIPKMIKEDRDALTSSQITEGMVIYNLTNRRLEYWNGVKWLHVGGGAMLNMIGYYRYGSYNTQLNHYIFPVTPIGASGDSTGRTRWIMNKSPLLVTSTQSNFIDTFTLQGYKEPINLLRPINKVYLTFPLVLGAVYTATKPSITATLNSVRFELLDNLTVIASKLINVNESYSVTNTTTLSGAGHILYAILDADDAEISDLRVKVTIDSTIAPTTEISAHRHYLYAESEGAIPAAMDYHPLEMQVLLS